MPRPRRNTADLPAAEPLDGRIRPIERSLPDTESELDEYIHLGRLRLRKNLFADMPKPPEDDDSAAIPRIKATPSWKRRLTARSMSRSRS